MREPGTQDLLEQSPQEFSGRCRRLEIIVDGLGLSSSWREAHIQEAKAAGMNYREALEHIIRQATGGAD